VSEPNFTLVQLRYFAAAARLGSMTAAARELLVSQSAVSTAVSTLEKELGVQLLIRHHARGLALTAAGREFYQELRGFLVHTAELAESAHRAGTEVVGNLTVGCFSTLVPFRIPGLLTAFAEQYPSVRVHVHEGEHAAVKRALRSGDCEIALLYGYDLDDDLDRESVDSVRPYAIVAAAHPLAQRPSRRVRLAELADEPMVLLDLPHTSNYMQSILAESGIRPTVRHRTGGYESVRSLVAHGLGFALLNQAPVHDMTYSGRRVVALELEDEVAPLDVVLARPRGARLTRRARCFAEMCRRTAAGRNVGASPIAAETD
jgi:DNA-binding transcriptional LysR family regulator